MDTQLIKIGEAAKLLNVSIDTLRRWDRSQKLLSIRVGEHGHRLYRFSDIESQLNSTINQRNTAFKWVESSQGFPLNAQQYCETRDVFQARLEGLQYDLMKVFPLEIVSLAIAVTGEIGNNSFDHNLGNWTDMMGIFFYYDEKKNMVVLADRGQGILRTLQRVRPELNTARAALTLAFTKTISGRQPEARGNGLKFVRAVVTNNPFVLNFQTGNAFLRLEQNNTKLFVHETSTTIQGCFATITIGKTP